MDRRRLRSVARRAPGIVLAVGALAGAVWSQCPAWLSGFEVADVHGSVQAMVVFDDGSGPALYVAGDFLSAGIAAAIDVARWDGATWSAVGSGVGTGLTNTHALTCLAVFDDGTGPALYAGGSFPSIDGVAASNVARWDGTSWAPLGIGLNNVCQTLVVHDDGTGPALYAGGSFNNAGGSGAAFCARWNGASWSGVGSGPIGTVHALAAFDDGSGSGPMLYAGGDFTHAGSTPVRSLARWNGTAWSAVGGGVGGFGAAGFVHDLLVHDDGSGPGLFVAGSFGGVDVLGSPTPAGSIARWNGTAWSTLAGGCTYQVPFPGQNAGLRDIAVFDDGSGPRLFAVGLFEVAGGVAAPSIARWDGSAWSSLGAGVASGGGTVDSLCVFDAGAGAQLYAGGSFSVIDGIPAGSIARWSGTAWSTPSPPGTPSPNGPVVALAVHDDGGGSALFAGGLLSRAGGVPVANVARWKDGQWSSVGAGFNSAVHVLHVHDDGTGKALYAGGQMPASGGVPVDGIARWDGSTWSPLGSGFDHGSELAIVRALTSFDDGSGPALYAGGEFSTAGGVPAENIARWNGSAWSPLLGGLSGTVVALAVFDDGAGSALYAGGTFLQANGASARRVARWNGTSWSALGSGATNGTNELVLTLAVYDDGTGSALYVGGGFWSAGGQSISRVARWDGASWSALAGTPPSSNVRDLCAFDDGTGTKLYACGDFTFAGGAPAPRIARWDGANWSALGGGLTGHPSAYVNALAEYSGALGEPPALHIGGSFVHAAGMPSQNLARYAACQPAHANFCAGDGTGTACPCANASAIGDDVGCRSSLGTGGRLRASGRASLANDTLLLSGSAMPSSSALYFQGTTRIAAGAGAAFGDGLRCAGGSVRRLGTRTNVAGESTVPWLGGAALSTLGALTGTGVRTYQVWYRNAAAFCTSDTFNLTNGVEVVWTM